MFYNFDPMKSLPVRAVRFFNSLPEDKLLTTEDLGPYKHMSALGLSSKALFQVARGFYIRSIECSWKQGESIPALTIAEVVHQLMEKLGVEYAPCEAMYYNLTGQSNQVPNGRVFCVRKPFTRPVTYNGVTLKFYVPTEVSFDTLKQFGQDLQASST